MANTVYLKIPTAVKVNKTHVLVGDIAKIYSSDKCLIQKIKPLKVYTFLNPKDNRDNHLSFSKCRCKSYR